MTSPQKFISCNKIKYNILHIKQQFNWDCGIACVLMLLSEDQRNEFLNNFSHICLEEGFKQNTWTIDLCYLLKRYNIKHYMFTKTKAPNRTSLNYEDSHRVYNRFKNARTNGITVIDSTLSIEELVGNVISIGPVIVLVDATFLSCDWCKNNKLNSEIRRIFGGVYKGHYILVVGWNAGKLLYLDPARHHSLCATTPKRLEGARRSPGTDFDAILVNRDYL